MKTSDFYYDLPKELIAQDPLEDRSASRLMHLNKETGEYEHGHFRDILKYLKPGDCLVINDTKVIPARLYGSKVGTDAVCGICGSLFFRKILRFTKVHPLRSFPMEIQFLASNPPGCAPIYVIYFTKQEKGETMQKHRKFIAGEFKLIHLGVAMQLPERNLHR